MLRVVGLFFFVWVVASIVLLIVGRKVRAWRRRRGLMRLSERRCACGYLLAGLEVPRCPECGRMLGFDKTAEELGISEAEMQ